MRGTWHLKAPDIHIEPPVHLLPQDTDAESIQRFVLRMHDPIAKELG